jgi:mannose-1-phosphate guanylyltransferase/mannose-6-phosphate isomerase
MIQVTPVILCGGAGTRLFPLSRTVFLKQFLCFNDNESLFQQAALRLTGLGNFANQVIVTFSVSGKDDCSLQQKKHKVEVHPTEVKHLQTEIA